MQGKDNVFVGWVEWSDTQQLNDGYRVAQPILRGLSSGSTRSAGMVAVFMDYLVHYKCDAYHRSVGRRAQAP